MKASLIIVAISGLLVSAAASNDTITVGSLNLTRADRAKFMHESELRGNATMEHVANWVAHQKRFENITCGNATFHMLSNGRFLETNYSTALSYGPVLGNVTAKSTRLCVLPYMEMNNLMPANSTGHVRRAHSRRWFESLFGNAIMWAAGFDFAGELFGAGCTIYDMVVGLDKVGNWVCNAGSLITAIGGGWDFVDAVQKSASTTVAQPAYNDYGVIPLGPLADYQVGNIPPFDHISFDPDYKKRHAPRSTNTTVFNRTATTLLRHGTEDRNLTWWEYATANFTHRSSFWYDGKSGGVPTALEFWHQPHPVNASRWTTHLGLNLSHITNNTVSSSTARHKRQSDNKRMDVDTWCNGGYAFSSWEPTDGEFEIFECNEDDNGGQSAGGGPGMLYYGLDNYAANEDSAFSWDMGTTNTENNGFGNSVELVTELTQADNTWDQCICLQENGQWLSTGSLQYSWDNTYNGYSQCWEANCGDPNGFHEANPLWKKRGSK